MATAGVGSERRRPRILGVGISCLDYLFRAPRVEIGHTGPLRDLIVAGGGLVGTAMVAAARLGAEAAIVGWVGDDDDGRLVIAGLQKEGVDTDGIEVVSERRTPVAVVHVEEETGERTIYFGRRLELPRDVTAQAGARWSPCDVLLVDPVWPAASEALAMRASEEGTPVVADFPPSDGLRKLTALVSAWIAPRSSVETLAAGGGIAEALAAMVRLGPEFAAITAGGDGCYFLDGGEMKHCPPFQADIVDTTGAGDVFHGAFSYGLALGWTAGQCVEFASAVAALSCRALGGRGGIPTLEETDSFMAESGRPRTWL